jgi:hypothetical protein
LHKPQGTLIPFVAAECPQFSAVEALPKDLSWINLRHGSPALAKRSRSTARGCQSGPFLSPPPLCPRGMTRHLCSSIGCLRLCGVIRLMELTRSFTPEQFAQGLESWQWASVGTKTPLFTSPFGDVFFRAEDGFLWWLDTIEGSLTRVWANADTLKADLATASGQDRYLLAGLGFAAERQGLIPGVGQVYGFKTPPALGARSTSATSRPSTSSCP